MSYNENTDKVTWKCYPTNVESFADVSYPNVDNVLQARKSLYQDINRIDNLPNLENVPDKVGPVDNLKGPLNKEPVRAASNTSLEPIIIITDVEPGMIMPGNLSFSLPNDITQNSALIYPDTKKDESRDSPRSLHGDRILKSPYVTIMETSQKNEPLRMEIDSNSLKVKEIADKHDNLRIMSQQEFHMATAVNENKESKEPVKITSVAQVQQIREIPELNQKPQSVAPENYPESKSLPAMRASKQKKGRRNNKLMHKTLMYVSIALVIYLIYVLFYEK
jgi:hypothetical protein